FPTTEQKPYIYYWVQNSILAMASITLMPFLSFVLAPGNNPTKLNCNNTSDQTFCCVFNVVSLSTILPPQLSKNSTDKDNLQSSKGVNDITLCALTVAASGGGNTGELQTRGNTGFRSTGGGDAGFCDAGLGNREGDM
ncbi:hypothetical protein MJO28_014772, partial [Puccinia striiformis f. sp. tritici]